MKLDPKHLIIDKPQLMNTKYRFVNILTFIFFWAVFVYLLRPLVILFGWIFMGYFANITMQYTHSIEEILLSNFAIGIYIMVALFPLWAMYNKVRFSGAKDKRRNAEHLVLDNEILIDQNIPVKYKNSLHDAKKSEFYFDERANIVGFNLDGKQTKITD